MPKISWPLGPIAHRGLHRSERGIVENTLSAVVAGMEHGYAVEVDLQPAKGEEPVVFHDEELDRLIDVKGLVKHYTPVRTRASPLQGDQGPDFHSRRAAGDGRGPGSAGHRGEDAVRRTGRL